MACGRGAAVWEEEEEEEEEASLELGELVRDEVLVLVLEEEPWFCSGRGAGRGAGGGDWEDACTGAAVLTRRGGAVSSEDVPGIELKVFVCKEKKRRVLFLLWNKGLGRRRALWSITVVGWLW